MKKEKLDELNLSTIGMARDVAYMLRGYLVLCEANKEDEAMIQKARSVAQRIRPLLFSVIPMDEKELKGVERRLSQIEKEGSVMREHKVRIIEANKHLQNYILHGVEDEGISDSLLCYCTNYEISLKELEMPEDLRGRIQVLFDKAEEKRLANVKERNEKAKNS